MMHGQNDYCFSKMMIKKYMRYLHYIKFWDNAMLQTEVGQVENEICKIAHVPAWMLQDKNT